jgi:multidrug resistance efflux pump
MGMKHFRTLTLIVLAVIIALAGVRVLKFETNASADQRAITPTPRPAPIALASPGRIEGRSENTIVGAGIDGVVRAIHVKEGQYVEEGAALADIACDDLAAALQVATAEAEALRQARTRVLRGARQEEREAAAQKTAAARALVQHTSAQLDRQTKLWEAASISRATFDEAQRDRDVAQADLKRAMREQELTNAGPLPEEIARADADVKAAEDRINVARDKAAKCTVRAPRSGSILRIHVRPGESFAMLAPRPLFTMADLSARRVRAEVDELDISKVRVGQKVIVTSDAYGGSKFAGNVVHIASLMGRKTVMTGDPASKEDKDVLEAVAELDSNATALPVGLRVTVQFVP